MDCFKCKVPPENTIIDGLYFKICPSCKNLTNVNNADGCCVDRVLEFRKKPRAGGGFILRLQCSNCGALAKSGIKQKEFNLDELSYYDENLNLSYSEKINEIFKNYITQKKEQEYNDWLKIADEYYKSEKWKLKRKYVFKRDNNLCQACLINPAEQVHHLTYKHFMNEPLFDLVSICTKCHEKITQMDRED